MKSESELLALHTKLAVMWIMFGIVIGSGVSWYVVSGNKRPVVEIRLSPTDGKIVEVPE